LGLRSCRADSTRRLCQSGFEQSGKQGTRTRARSGYKPNPAHPESIDYQAKELDTAWALWQ